MKGLTDIPGILVGHASDFEGITGCTAIVFPQGAVAGIDVRGSATGGEEWDVLQPHHVTDRIHGLCLSGGSAFGLEASSGVRRHLEKKGIGFAFGGSRIPIVAGAILFDLAIGRSDRRPGREMGETAAAAATDGAVAEGSVGAGTGATVGKVLGMSHAMKGGVGSYTVSLGGANAGVLVSALAVTNPLGDVIDPATQQIVAGARKAPASSQFVNTAKMMVSGLQGGFTGNTTLVVVATNAILDKVQAVKLAQFGQHGMVRSIAPIHTTSDGDVVFTASVGNQKCDLNVLGMAAAEAVSQAILRSVRMAKPLGGVPSVEQLFSVRQK